MIEGLMVGMIERFLKVWPPLSRTEAEIEGRGFAEMRGILKLRGRLLPLEGRVGILRDNRLVTALNEYRYMPDVALWLLS